MKADPQQIYRDGRGRVTALVRDLDADALSARVPACPSWTVRDLLCHLVGLPTDVLAGRVDGAGTDPWTAAQLASRTGCDRDTLLAEWEREAPAFEALIPMIDPPLPVYDIIVHEQDLRGALGTPGARDSAGVRMLVDVALGRLASEIDAAELPALEIAMEDEGFVAGSGDVRRPVGCRALRAVPFLRRSSERRAGEGLGLPRGLREARALPPDGPRGRDRAVVALPLPRVSVANCATTGRVRATDRQVRARSDR